MARGETHTIVTIAATVPTFAVAAYVTRDPGLAALAAAGTLSGVLLSPDLDHDWRTESELILWRITPAIGIPWSVIWCPYQYLIPHRSPLSHWPLVGTLGRVLYVVALLLLAQVHLRAVGVPFDAMFWTQWPAASAAFCAGLAVSDFGHWLFDGCPI